MQQPIRILHLLYCMDRAGAETMVMNYYRNVDKSKVQFDFLLTRDGKSDFDDEILSMGGRIYHIPGLSFSNPFKYLNSLKAFLNEHPEYKIIHSHTDCKSTIPLWVAKKQNIPVRISHSHTSSTGGGVQGIIKSIVKKPIKKVATNYFACGEAASKFLYGQTSDENDKIKIIPNAIDAAAYSYNPETRKRIRAQFNLEDKFVLGHVGRFATPKNHEFLIDIFSAVHKKNPDTALLLVGEGELTDKIKEKVSALNLSDSVVFAGLRDDIPDVLQAMDLFVFPSLFEGLGIVAIEAQAAGLRVICSDAVPKEANISGYVSYIPLSKSADEWASEVLKLSGGYTRENTFELVKKANYDIKESAKDLQDFYLALYN